MSDKKYNVRSRKVFGEENHLDRTKINDLLEGELIGEEEEVVVRFNENQRPVNTMD